MNSERQRIATAVHAEAERDELRRLSRDEMRKINAENAQLRADITALRDEVMELKREVNKHEKSWFLLRNPW